MWEIDHKEGWAPKTWCFRTVLLEKTLESPLDFKGIQPVNPKGDQSWTLIQRTDAEAEAPILWPPDAKSWCIGKDPYSGKDWGQEEQGATKGEMVEWHHQLNGHDFEQTPGDSEGMLQSMGLQRLRHNWVTEQTTITIRLIESVMNPKLHIFFFFFFSRSLASKQKIKQPGKITSCYWQLRDIHVASYYCWRRKWQPTPLILPGEFHGQRSLASYIQSMVLQRVRHDRATTTHSYYCKQW